MGTIYVLTNKRNNKKYVGQTIYSFDCRLNQHIKCARLGSELAIHRAMRKHGMENFSYETRNVPDNLLDYYEIFLIKKLDSFGQHGYNLTRGGSGVKLINQSVRDQIKLLWDRGWSSPDIAFEVEVCVASVRNILSSAGVSGQQQKERGITSLTRGFSRHSVIEIAVNSKKIIKVNNSITEAAGGDTAFVSQISECCLGHRATAGGSFWRYAEDVSLEELEAGIYTGILPDRMGLDWNKTYDYDTVRFLWDSGLTGTEITQKLGCRNVGYILDKLGISKEERQLRANRLKSRAVNAFNKDGVMIAEYDSIAEAASSAGSYSSSVIRAAQYHRLLANRQWRYKDSLTDEELSTGFIGPYFDLPRINNQNKGKTVLLVSSRDGSKQKFYSVREAGRKLGIASSTVNKYINEGLEINNSRLYYENEMGNSNENSHSK